MTPTPMKPPVTGQSKSDEISVELSARRTGMSFQRTRMSADRTLMSVIRTSLSLIGFGFTIYQVFEKLRDAAISLRSRCFPSRRAGSFRAWNVTIARSLGTSSTGAPRSCTTVYSCRYGTDTCSPPSARRISTASTACSR